MSHPKNTSPFFRLPAQCPACLCVWHARRQALQAGLFILSRYGVIY